MVLTEPRIKVSVLMEVFHVCVNFSLAIWCSRLCGIFVLLVQTIASMVCTCCLQTFFSGLHSTAVVAMFPVGQAQTTVVMIAVSFVVLCNTMLLLYALSSIGNMCMITLYCLLNAVHQRY